VPQVWFVNLGLSDLPSSSTCPRPRHSPLHPYHSTLIFARSLHSTLPISKSMLSLPLVSRLNPAFYVPALGRPSKNPRYPSTPSFEMFVYYLSAQHRAQPRAGTFPSSSVRVTEH